MNIPKIIYQTWKTKNLHENCIKIRDNIQKLNPEYTMILYDDNDMDSFIKTNYNNYVYNCYKQLNIGAAKADFWRYCILHKNGGVYLDMDSNILRPLNELIESNDQCIITREGNKGIFNNWIMIFEKNHPILQNAIHKCCYNISNKTTNNILLLTGPHGPFTDAINETMVPLYIKKTHLYYEPDNELNDILNKPLNAIRCRFYGVDMESFATWKHEYCDDLYANSVHWSRDNSNIMSRDNSNIIFISVFNLGCIEIAENHLLSLIKSGIENYRAYVTDKESFDILTLKGYKVIHYDDFDIKDKMDFGTSNFNNLSFIRYKIINQLLKENQIVWYLDVDTVVLHDLNLIAQELMVNKFDLVMQHDLNMPCSGCMLYFPNNKTIELTDSMYNNQTSNTNDQQILGRILIENKTNLQYSLFSIEHFPNGLLYFNDLHDDPRYRNIQLQFKKSVNPVYFVHANWMVGIDTKINALKSKNLWYL